MSVRTTGYVPNFKTPSRQAPSARMWIIVALCVCLPPLGLLLLWSQARNPLRGKLIVSFIGVISLTLMLTLYISNRQTYGYRMEQVSPNYNYLSQQQQTAATAAPETEGASLPESEGETPPTQPETSLIPANPNR